MSVELTGLAGILKIEPDGSFVVTRGEETVLALRRVFIETYGVRFPIVGQIHMRSDGGKLEASFKTMGGTHQVTFEATAEAGGFLLVWSAPSPAASVGLAFSLLPGGPWYGMGERLIQSWPLSKLNASSDPFGPVDTGRDGTLNIATPLWLNRAGAGILLDEDPGELALTLSQNGNDELQILRRAPELAPMIREQAVERVPARLTVHLLVGNHIRAARSLALNYLGRPTAAPPLELFARPIWTTWARYKMHITQAQTIQFADEILAHDYPHCVMEIDDRWQSTYGDLRFDPAKFPDPQAMVKQLHDRGFRVTLWVPPFLNPDSQAYRQAAAGRYLLCQDGSDEPMLTRWWQGYGGLVDMSNPAALDWWLAGLRRLQGEYGVDGFKFDAGEANYVPRGARSASNLQPNSQ